MSVFALPELEQPYDIHDVLTTARFRVVPDKRTEIEDIFARTISSGVVLTVQPEHGGHLTSGFLERHHVDPESLVAFLTHKGMGELREHFTPSLKPDDAHVYVHVREVGRLRWYKVIIHHRCFDRKHLLEVLAH